jgi:hypothetical protein
MLGVPMPTLSKPKLKETPSVWLEPSRRIECELTAIKGTVLQELGFYREHGRPEDFGGKFKKQILAHEKELLSEIVGALTLAAAISASVSRPVLIATLERVRKNPKLIFKKHFPGAVLWIVARTYQRANEKPGTFWPDIIGELPKNFHGQLEKPTPASIETAASRALVSLRKGRMPGRPRNFANESLAENLGPIFRRYDGKVVRHSEETSLGRGRLHQIDAGPFLDFIKAVLKPLQAYLKANDFPRVSASGVVSHAVRMQSR